MSIPPMKEQLSLRQEDAPNPWLRDRLRSRLSKGRSRRWPPYACEAANVGFLVPGLFWSGSERSDDNAE
jgi:hypothetical protein